MGRRRWGWQAAAKSSSDFLPPMRHGSTSIATTVLPDAPSQLRRVPFLRLPVRARQAREAVGGCQSRAPVLLGHASSHGRRAGRPGRLHHRRGALPRAARTRSYDDLSVARHRRRRRGRSRVGARAPHRFRKNFSLGWRGWADLRLAVADLSRGRVTTNSQGKPLGKTLQANAFIDDGAAVCAAGCGGARDAARNTARGAVRDGHRLDASAPAFPEGREGRACDGARPLFEAQGEKRGSKL